MYFFLMLLGTMQTCLPVAYGGIGIRHLFASVNCFMAGLDALIYRLLPPRLHDSSGTCDKTFLPASSMWADNASISQILTTPFSDRQKVWVATFVNVKRERLFSAAASQAAKARLIVAAAHSGAFLNVRPCSTL